MDLNQSKELNTCLSDKEESNKESSSTLESVNCNSVVNSNDNEVESKPDSNVTQNGQITEESCKIQTEVGDEKISQAEVIVSKPLCANYRSDSESVDSESDSTTTLSDTSDSETDDDSSSSDSDTKKKKSNKSKQEPTYYDLPLIEELKISVPETSCVEVGVISSIVETLVVVESFKGSAALDVDTVLFLENGKRTLGKVFDILGPITEPVYTVRFNSEEQIKNLGIEKSMKVYYAPQTPHTNFVFMSEVLKNRGSDASWKDNVEAPPEFQDFSDDEEERRHRNKESKEPDEEKSQPKLRKRFIRTKPPPNGPTNRFRQPNFSQQFRSCQPPPPPSTPQGSSYPLRPYLPSPNPPPYYYPHQMRFSRPYFPPTFGGLPSFTQPTFYQQTTQGYHQWGGHMYGSFLHTPPPPPPPPPSEQRYQQTGQNPHG